VAGATVALLPVEDACAQPLTTAKAGADGRFCLDAAEGSYFVRATADGHATVLDSLEVGAAARETVEIVLLVGTDPAPAITLVGPEVGADGKARVGDPTVVLSWRTSGISPVETKVNGEVVVPTGGENPQEGDTLQVVAGLALKDGENTFEIQVTGQCGTKATATVVVIHDASIPGTDAGVPAETDGGTVGQADAAGQVVEPTKGGCGCGGAGAAVPLASLLGLSLLARRRREG